MKEAVKNTIKKLASTHTEINAEHYEIGKHVVIEDNVRITAKKLFIGDGVRINSGCRFEFTSDLFIGDYTAIKNNCFFSGTHWCYIGCNCWLGHYTVLDSIGTLYMGNNVGVGAHSQLWSHIKFGDVLEGSRFDSRKPLIIDDDVWFVGHSIVSPIHAGEKSMALVGSVVTKDLECNKIYAGNPAVDISDRIGNQFAAVSNEDKKAKLIEYRQAFYNEYPQHANSIEIVPEITDVAKCQFSYVNRNYTKTLSRSEFHFVKFLFPDKAKFYPIAERNWVRREFDRLYGDCL